MAAFKDILVIVDSAPGCEARLDLATALAARFGARLTGLFVSPPPDLPAMVEPPTAAALLVEEELRSENEMRAHGRELFDRSAAARGVRTEWRAAEGEAGRAATIHAHYADLTIVGQASPDAPTPVRTDLPERVVLGAGRPVLVVPYAGTFASLGQRALIAWNESREAAHAVHAAMPLLAGAAKVTVLSIDADDGEDAEDDSGAAHLVEHLARHGVPAEPSVMRSDDLDVSALLLSRAADLAADLIVMGAYGHSRLREVVLGGATRDIFRTMTVPVLMAH